MAPICPPCQADVHHQSRLTAARAEKVSVEVQSKQGTKEFIYLTIALHLMCSLGLHNPTAYIHVCIVVGPELIIDSLYM